MSEAEMKINEVVQGHNLDVMREWPDGCIDTCVTSPPYWGLRDYGIPPVEWPEVTFAPMPGLPPMTIPAESSVHGLEKNIWAYVAHEVLIFREVRRLLADHGVLFLNLGDSYANDGKWGGSTGGKHVDALHGGNGPGRRRHDTGLKPKDLCAIPWRVALSLQGDGWWLRQDIIWHKPNPMPESVTDRCTKAHEYIFLLVKSADYCWDAESIKEASVDPDGSAARYNYDFSGRPGLVMPDGDEQHIAPKGHRDFSGTRNRRSVWTITTQGTKDAHFATFPPKLVEPMILAGCPREVCTVCGKPRERILEKNRVATRPGTGSKVHDVGANAIVNRVHHETQVGNRDPERHVTETQTVGWSDCGHASYRPGRVLDPFGGSGTVGYVAAKLKRDYLLIEMNPAYIQGIARTRLMEAETGVSKKEIRQGQGVLFGA